MKDVEDIITKEMKDDYYKYVNKRVEFLAKHIDDCFWEWDRAVNNIAFIEKDGVYSFVIAANLFKSDFEKIRDCFYNIRKERGILPLLEKE